MNTLISIAIGLLVAIAAHVALAARGGRHNRWTVAACAALLVFANALFVDWSVVLGAPVTDIATMLGIGWLFSMVAFLALSPSAIMALMKRA